MLRFTNKNELATKASYEVTHLLAKRMKSFSDAELIKDLLQSSISKTPVDINNIIKETERYHPSISKQH